MEHPSPDEHILRDLALLYIALAHGADQDLSAAEMDIITQRLQESRAGVSQGTVLRAIKDALDAYTQGDARQRIDQAILYLSEAVPPNMRPRILKDLTEIGKADDRFLYAEARFIGDLVNAWRRDVTDQPDASAAAWSIFGPVEGEWTLVHDLALIYVTLAQQTDQELKRVEVEAITRKIGEWMPSADPETLRRVLREVLTVYEQQPEGRTFDDAVEALQKQLPHHQRAAVLTDLRYIADADGVLLVEERVLIEKLAKAWGSASGHVDG